MFKPGVISQKYLIGVSLALIVLCLLILILWKSSLDHLYSSQRLFLVTLNELQVKTLEIRVSLLSFLSPFGCSSGAKIKIKENSENINKLMSEQSIDASSLAAEELLYVGQIYSGKNDLDSLIERSLEMLKNEDKDGVALLADKDWPTIITNFIKPITRLAEQRRLYIERSYNNSIQYVQAGFCFVITLLVGAFVYLILPAVQSRKK